MLNMQTNAAHSVISKFTDKKLAHNTIFNHFDNPLLFMDAVSEWEGVFSDGKVPSLIQAGKDEFKAIANKDTSNSTLYKDVALKVRDKLISRGFTTALLYSTAEFTSTKTGVMSKQRALMGKRDCYFKNPAMTDAKLFHDIYINLSYDINVDDKTIERNSYALYALTKELSKLIPMRVFVINHVSANTPICYSYAIKKYGSVITPEEFLFFTGASKRTFGFALYDIMNNGYNNVATVGEPDNTVSIADFDLDEQITSIIDTLKTRQPEKFKGISND